MSRRNQKPYHDDDRYMPIVDYSTPRRGEDLTSPNAARQTTNNQPSDTVIVPSSPVHQTTRVIEDSLFITERAGPFELDAGDALDVVSLTGESGDIISIELVTDNPYTGLYLEMDDYKNRERVGVTAAELIMKNKITPSNREFYAEDMREDGTFVVKYSPSVPDRYSDRIKVQVRNDITGIRNPRGQPPGQRLKMRNGLPSPLYLGFAGGFCVTDPNFASLTVGEVSTLLQKQGRNQYFSPIRNLAVLEDESLRVGAYHPYMGIASKMELTILTEASTVAGARLVGGATGVKASDATGFPAPSTVPWPGKMLNGTFVPSEQQFILYKDATENPATTGLFAPGTPTGSIIFLKVGDTVYFPGETVNESHFYDAATSQWQPFDGSNGFQDGTDGAHMFTVSPGLPFKPPKVDKLLGGSSDDAEELNFDGFGLVQGINSQNPKIQSGKMLIHEIIVRRKRQMTLLL